MADFESLHDDMEITKVACINPYEFNDWLAHPYYPNAWSVWGSPCIRGMRIWVTDILEMLAENVSVTEILDDSPDLELADIQACLLFAAG